MSRKAGKGLVKDSRTDPTLGCVEPWGRGPGAEGPQGIRLWGGAGSSTGRMGCGATGQGPRPGPGSLQVAGCRPALTVPCVLTVVLRSHFSPW